MYPTEGVRLVLKACFSYLVTIATLPQQAAPLTSSPVCSAVHPSTATMVAVKRKRSGQEYGEDEKLLHQVHKAAMESWAEIVVAVYCHKFTTTGVLTINTDLVQRNSRVIPTISSLKLKQTCLLVASALCLCMLGYHLIVMSFSIDATL